MIGVQSGRVRRLAVPFSRILTVLIPGRVSVLASELATELASSLASGRASSLVLSLILALVASPPAAASVHRAHHAAPAPSRPRAAAPARKLPASYSAALVVDAETGQVFFEKNQDEPRAPASLTKMMTELITLESAEKGTISLDDIVVVPTDVRTVGGTRVHLRPGDRLPLTDAIKAMAIASANDAAVAVAHHVAGSVDRFVEMMNQRARELGMDHTHYVTVNGLDPNNAPGSITTARDQALLARTLIRHRLALQISSTVYDTIRSRQIIHTTNRLLGRCEGVDGLKTGYTSKAGFCLVSTARKGDLRVVSVLLGATSNRRRFSESETLLNDVFSRFQKVPVIRKGQDLGQACSTAGGDPPQVRLVAGEDVDLLLPAAMHPDIRLRVTAPSAVHPPVAEGRALGRLQILIGDSLAAEAPAVADRPVRKTGLRDKLGL